MRHETWMERDERTPLEKMQQRIRSLEYQEAELVKRLQDVRDDKMKLSLQICGLLPADT